MAVMVVLTVLIGVAVLGAIGYLIDRSVERLERGQSAERAKKNSPSADVPVYNGPSERPPQ